MNAEVFRTAKTDDLVHMLATLTAAGTPPMGGAPEAEAWFEEQHESTIEDIRAELKRRGVLPS